mgnify:CR=1 FL=1
MTSQIWYIEGFEENYCRECVKIALDELRKEEPEEDFKVYIDDCMNFHTNEDVFCEKCLMKLEK